MAYTWTPRISVAVTISTSSFRLPWRYPPFSSLRCWLIGPGDGSCSVEVCCWQVFCCCSRHPSPQVLYWTYVGSMRWRWRWRKLETWWNGKKLKITWFSSLKLIINIIINFLVDFMIAWYESIIWLANLLSMQGYVIPPICTFTSCSSYKCICIQAGIKTPLKPLLLKDKQLRNHPLSWSLPLCSRHSHSIY